VSFRHHLVRWEKEYAKDGLVVVEVSGGELASLERSQKLLGDRELGHPVLWDEANRNHKTYGISSWPAAYLIGADGKVFWEGNPARARFRRQEVDEMRALLEKHLERTNKDK
jgi:hypothetical protein